MYRTSIRGARRGQALLPPATANVTDTTCAGARPAAGQKGRSSLSRRYLGHYIVPGRLVCPVRGLVGPFVLEGRRWRPLRIGYWRLVAKDLVFAASKTRKKVAHYKELVDGPVAARLYGHHKAGPVEQPKALKQKAYPDLFRLGGPQKDVGNSDASARL